MLGDSRDSGCQDPFSIAFGDVQDPAPQLLTSDIYLGRICYLVVATSSTHPSRIRIVAASSHDADSQFRFCASPRWLLDDGPWTGFGSRNRGYLVCRL